MLAIIEAYRLGLLKPKYWLNNLTAGLIVGVVALPLAMAFAIASGVKPEQGLYTAIVAGIIVSVFGGSRVQIAGPTGAFIVILANITAKHGVDGLQVASLLAGFILLFMGIIRLGNVIKYIPDPVIVGFTSGIGIIIFVGEWKDFLGLPVVYHLNAHFFQKLSALIKSLPLLNLETTALGFLSLLVAVITPKFIKRIPGPLFAMAVAMSLQAIFHFKNVATLGSAFNGIPNHLPHFHIPSINFSHYSDLVAPAFTIALLGAVESLLSATAADGLAGTRHNSNQELVGQGLANICAPLFGGFAATGAIARTATNIRNGGNSPIAAIVHSLVLFLVILLFAPFAANIPLCTLAAILFVVAYNMSDIPHFIRMFKHAPFYDVLVLVVTFLLTIFTDLVVAVSVGVILAMLCFVRRMTQITTVEQQAVPDVMGISKDTIIYTIQGPLFFGVAEKVERALAVTNEDPNIIIFRLKNVPFMDITGMETFSELIKEFNKRKVKVYLCEANLKVMHKIVKLDILHLIANKNIFASFEEVLQLSKST